MSIAPKDWPAGGTVRSDPDKDRLTHTHVLTHRDKNGAWCCNRGTLAMWLGYTLQTYHDLEREPEGGGMLLDPATGEVWTVESRYHTDKGWYARAACPDRLHPFNDEEFTSMLPLDADVYRASLAPESGETCPNCGGEITERDDFHGCVGCCEAAGIYRNMPPIVNAGRDGITPELPTHQNGKWCECETCQGEGEIDNRLGGEAHSGISPCPDCDGAGDWFNETPTHQNCADGRDAGKPCLRACEAERVWGDDWRWSFGTTEDEVSDMMPRLAALLDHWGPRLSEFEPCGDCPNCLSRAERDGLEDDLMAWGDERQPAGDVDLRAREDAAAESRKREWWERMGRIAR